MDTSPPMSGHEARAGRGPGEGTAPPRFWQVPEAEEELFHLAPKFRGLRVKVARLLEVTEELDRLSKLWGEEFGASDHPDAARKKDLESQAGSLQAEVETELEGWRKRGIEVKDLSTGLVDFYALRKGEIILLCWKSGEDGIRFWHTIEGGYRMRRPLSPSERAGGLDVLPTPRSAPRKG